MSTHTDQELALRTKRGEVAAFGELIRRYQTSVFNVCYRFVGERREAEDITQEAFIRAYQRFNLYNEDRPFGPWMRKLAANLCLNRLKSQPVSTVVFQEEYDHPAADLKNPEKALEQSEIDETVREAIWALPPHFRGVIELRHFQDMSYSEIADELAIPISDVKSHLFRARKMLAKRLAAYV